MTLWLVRSRIYHFFKKWELTHSHNQMNIKSDVTKYRFSVFCAYEQCFVSFSPLPLGPKRGGGSSWSLVLMHEWELSPRRPPRPPHVSPSQLLFDTGLQPARFRQSLWEDACMLCVDFASQGHITYTTLAFQPVEAEKRLLQNQGAFQDVSKLFAS